MGRWRAATKSASPYITAAGYRALEVELAAIWQRRRDVVKHLAAAAAEGDRSENAEYIYRKKELGGIDHRIRYLQVRMPRLNIVTETTGDRERVYFGASVELETDDGELQCYRIVGSDEADPKRGWISIDAPLAQALLKCALDDELNLDMATGRVRFTIRSITYLDPNETPDAL